MLIKYFITFLFCIFFSLWSNAQVNVGLSLGVNFENLDISGNPYALKPKYGNNGVQIGLNSELNLSPNFKMMLDLYYIPEKKIPLIALTFSDNLEYYSHQIIRSSLSLGYTFKNLTVGLGPSLSEFYSRNVIWQDLGRVPRDNCTMFGGVFTLAYRYKQFYFHAKYRQEVHSNLPLGCSAIRGVRALEFNLVYFITRNKNR